ncbi:TetR/AcrR family transcriptional regulator [Iamia sp. SCSIO 61187]|uniref:TetR/AcrR family transcriptional regulator n=1 Tax=Iamia sp. SCSIO 61187 TaxID=2722752 RepID=UPI001C6360E9|nr:TetR/AcrR family transcriptional regulator [Iamia sp. SCSIO 61187]QYG92182.1 TetR/AcrR family transcriptional regulator [Iamia sp. SCSIO 61187]
MAPSAPLRRSGRRASPERRDAFLDAAVTAIRRDGPKVSMETIAREAGVTKPIVYRLFGDRDGLLQALGERLAADINANIAEALDRAPDDDPKAMLRTAIASYVELIDTETDVYRFVTEQIGRTTSGPNVTGLAAEIARSVAVVLGEELRRAGADSGAAEPWAFGIVGMVHLSGDWWVRTRTLPRDQLVTYLVDLLWDGFGALAPAPRPPSDPG